MPLVLATALQKNLLKTRVIRAGIRLFFAGPELVQVRVGEKVVFVGKAFRVKNVSGGKPSKGRKSVKIPAGNVSVQADSHLSGNRMESLFPALACAEDFCAIRCKSFLFWGFQKQGSVRRNGKIFLTAFQRGEQFGIACNRKAGDTGCTG